jgi:hypothetical protein
VNRIFLSRFAACRTRSSALGAACRPCVRAAFCWRGFPLVSRLPSTTSSVGRPTSFGGFFGTSQLSDFPEPCIIGVRLLASRCGPRLHLPWATLGSPGSRAWSFRACAGSLTARGPSASRAGDASGVAFRFSLQRRRPGDSYFRGCIPGPHVPLSTLRRAPRGTRRTTRGRRGSLVLHRMTLPFTSPCRFRPAHKEAHDGKVHLHLSATH